MYFTSDIIIILFLTLVTCSKYVFTVDNTTPSNTEIISQKSTANKTKIKANIKDDIKELGSSSSNSDSLANTVNYGNYALEGGGVPQQTLSTFNNIEHGEEYHSKGRKGVGHPGSSVVPRKGVESPGIQGSLSQSGDSSLDKDTTTTSSLMQDEILSKTNASQVQNKTLQGTSAPEEVTEQHPIPKKPEVVSDLGDADEYNSYTIIKTSTTGEDYVIIGIVIVIGIWCAVFGALIFYRRAGEYWDRRHYRRMDFLVEGMYND